MPARFRKSFEKPEALIPNEPSYLAFTMPGITHTFKKGHRIMVQIQSTWFPLVARNPQQFLPNYKLATQKDFRTATQRIHYGGGTRSAIILPIMKK
jgi:predicted acyl esterase